MRRYEDYSRDLKNAIANLASELIKQNKITIEYYNGLVQAFYAEKVWERLQEIAYETGVLKKWDADLLGKLDNVEIGQTLTTIRGVTGEVVAFNDDEIELKIANGIVKRFKNDKKFFAK